MLGRQAGAAELGVMHAIDAPVPPDVPVTVAVTVPPDEDCHSTSWWLAAVPIKVHPLPALGVAPE